METWQVQLWPDGQWDGQPHKKIEANSAKEAAEQLYGGPLSEVGSMHQLRATVRMRRGTVWSPVPFYAPA